MFYKFVKYAFHVSRETFRKELLLKRTLSFSDFERRLFKIWPESSQHGCQSCIPLVQKNISGIFFVFEKKSIFPGLRAKVFRIFGKKCSVCLSKLCFACLEQILVVFLRKIIHQTFSKKLFYRVVKTAFPITREIFCDFFRKIPTNFVLCAKVFEFF